MATITKKYTLGWFGGCDCEDTMVSVFENTNTRGKLTFISTDFSGSTYNFARVSSSLDRLTCGRFYITANESGTDIDVPYYNIISTDGKSISACCESAPPPVIPTPEPVEASPTPPPVSTPESTGDSVDSPTPTPAPTPTPEPPCCNGFQYTHTKSTEDDPTQTGEAYGNVELQKSVNPFYDDFPQWNISTLCHNGATGGVPARSPIDIRSHQDYFGMTDFPYKHGEIALGAEYTGEMRITLINGDCYHACVDPEVDEILFVPRSEPLNCGGSS